MKKFFITMMGLLVVISCGQKPRSSSADDEDEDEDERTEQKDERDDDADDDAELKTRSYSYSYESGKLEVGIEADYPVGGGEALCNAVREYISEQLGGNYDGNLDKGKAVVDFYGAQIREKLESSLEAERENTEEDNINGFYHNYRLKKLYETDRLVTYSYEESIYLNGAHGMEYYYGATFRKSDGRRFTTEMMHGIGTEDMYKVIKEGLRSYFSDNDGHTLTDEELKEYILTEDDVNYLPMPQNTPYVTKDGLTFTYQPYEISFYAAGMPQFSVPLNKMKPFLGTTARKMFGVE